MTDDGWPDLDESKKEQAPPKEQAPAKKQDRSMIDREARLASYDGEDRVINFAEAKMIASLRPKCKLHFKTAFGKLDEATGGFDPGQLVVVSGPTGSGKTLLLQTLTNSFAKQGVPSLWFSYEVNDDDFLLAFPKDLGQYPAYLPATLKSRALDWVEERVMEGIVKFDTRVVMIDHLHYLVDMERMRQPSLEIGAVMRRLKRMAIEHTICIFLVAHTGKIPSGEVPSMERIRDSSFCVQEPDVVLVVWRVKDDASKGYHNEARLSVEKCRRTGARCKLIRLKKEAQWLSEVQGGTEPEPDY